MSLLLSPAPLQAPSLVAPSARGGARSRTHLGCVASAGPTAGPAGSWSRSAATALGASALSIALAVAPPALAGLNKFEEASFGEFDRGSAKQFGEANKKGVDFVKEYGKDLRLSKCVCSSCGFTATDMRGAKLRGADVRGAYFIKVVAPDCDFTGTDFSDALMDRGVFVNSIFRDAVLARVVLTLSDLQGADVTNADFSDALLDKKQQEGLCKTASGTNPSTGVATRKSLGCGGRPRGSPSLYMTDADSVKPEPLFEPERFSSYGN